MSLMLPLQDFINFRVTVAELVHLFGKLPVTVAIGLTHMVTFVPVHVQVWKVDPRVQTGTHSLSQSRHRLFGRVLSTIDTCY